MKTNIEYKKGVLFVRVNGDLINKNINEFENELIPIVLQVGIKFLALNLENLNSIDNSGVNSLLNIYKLIKSNCGKITFCNINDKMKIQINESVLNDKFYKTDSELTALELFKL